MGRKVAEQSGEAAGVGSGEGASTQVKPTRRSFGVEYKRRILEETDAAKATGEVGAILRREGLYSSHLTTWRREREDGLRAGLGRKGGRKPTRTPLHKQLEQLEREKARLEKRLQQAELIIDVQKKVASMLGITLAQPENDGSDS